jgi:hypothetical protein
LQVIAFSPLGASERNTASKSCSDCWATEEVADQIKDSVKNQTSFQLLFNVFIGPTFSSILLRLFESNE